MGWAIGWIGSERVLESLTAPAYMLSTSWQGKGGRSGELSVGYPMKSFSEAVLIEICPVPLQTNAILPYSEDPPFTLLYFHMGVT